MTPDTSHPMTKQHRAMCRDCRRADLIDTQTRAKVMSGTLTGALRDAPWTDVGPR